MLARAAVAVVLGSGVAAADHETGHIPEPPLPSDMTISLAGGADGFLGGTARSTFGIGGAWAVRVAFGSRSEIRTELVYAGSTQSASAGGAGSLVGHGVHGVLRVNVAPKWEVIEPFFYAGAGWSRYHVTGDMDELYTSPDHVIEIPFGFGAARRLGDFVLDARAGVSIISAADLFPADPASTSPTEGGSLHRFGVRASIGIEL